MAKLEFRDLKADEIDVRIATFKEGKGMSLLLYKDARCDMNILDETVGAYNWQRSHSRDNANCTVSIWDDDKKQWICKEDVGTESNTEATKGLASDSFKRACFNWGIGRELYTAPFIWVGTSGFNDKYDKFKVKDINIKGKKIVALSIYNETMKKVVYTFGNVGKTSAKKETVAAEQATPAPAAPQQNNDAPYEVIDGETFRDKFRKYITDKKLSDSQINQILNTCNLQKDSPDSEWENGLMYAIAMYGGAQA